MKIIELAVQNFLGVKAVTIKPGDNVVSIEGKNGAGKSSVIDSIWAAIGGKKEQPINPVRKGEKKASIYVDLGEIRVTKVITENTEKLEVTNSEGLVFKSPQNLLASFFSKISIDPQRFIDLSPAERKETLLDLTGQKEKIEALDAKRKELYDERTLINREIKTLEGKLIGQPELGPPLVDISILNERLERERDKADLLKDCIYDKNALTHTLNGLDDSIIDAEEQVRIYQNRIDTFRTQKEDVQKKINSLAKTIENAPENQSDIISLEIKKAEENNTLARNYQFAENMRLDLRSKNDESVKLTGAIKQVDAEKSTILNSSQMPIENISFNEDVLMIGDIPFDDMNESEQLKVSMRIGMATNPRIRVLSIARGNELDTDNMKVVEEFARKNDVQIWIQRVCEESQGGFFIEDGELKNTEGEGNNGN